MIISKNGRWCKIAPDRRLADEGKRLSSDGRFILMRSSNGEGVWGRGSSRSLRGGGLQVAPGRRTCRSSCGKVAQSVARPYLVTRSGVVRCIATSAADRRTWSSALRPERGGARQPPSPSRKRLMPLSWTRCHRPFLSRAKACPVFHRHPQLQCRFSGTCSPAANGNGTLLPRRQASAFHRCLCDGGGQNG